MSDVPWMLVFWICLAGAACLAGHKFGVDELMCLGIGAVMGICIGVVEMGEWSDKIRRKYNSHK